MDSPDERSMLKRKRTPDSDHHMSLPSAPPSKSARTSGHLAINYLARQLHDDLPLVTVEDPLPALLQLLGEYAGVLDRHESLALNLGAKPLGPILIKRFERLFDGPPKVLKTHSKEGGTVTWLDVVEFARNKPEQFTLGQMSEGMRVCQFYTKQCRVQISEEDYVLISSGMPQKLIPPQPVVEDEEKELGTLEIMERNLTLVCQMADQVAARGRQIRHRVLSRKQAILDRRASDSSGTFRSESPTNNPMMNGDGNGSTSPGFIAVNAKPLEGNGTSDLSRGGASDSTKSELIKQFSTVRLMRRFANGDLYASASSIAISPGRSLGGTPSSKLDMSNDFLAFGAPTNGNPSMFSASTSTPKADDGPYKAEMMNRMESIKRGDRVVPPCDRCRRLHMDCIKNLTACLGCTKKHAKCGWRDVHPDELSGTAPPSLPVDDMDPDNALEFLQKRDAGNGIHPADHSPLSASNTDMPTAADLAEVAKASTAALESTETDLAPHHHSRDHHAHQHHHLPVQVQSPNMAAPMTHQSPNIAPYGSFSPQHHVAVSVNMPYAPGRRASSPLPTLSGAEDVGPDDKFDMSASDKDPIDGRPVESLLTS